MGTATQNDAATQAQPFVPAPHPGESCNVYASQRAIRKRKTTNCQNRYSPNDTGPVLICRTWQGCVADLAAAQPARNIRCSRANCYFHDSRKASPAPTLKAR